MIDYQACGWVLSVRVDLCRVTSSITLKGIVPSLTLPELWFRVCRIEGWHRVTFTSVNLFYAVSGGVRSGGVGLVGVWI